MRGTQKGSSTQTWARRAPAWGAILLALTGIALGLAESQSQAQQQLNQTFQTRAEIAKQFVASYVADVFNREETVSAEQLAGVTISDAQFQAVVQSFGFTAAVVLDDKGRALDIFPAATGKIGTNLAAQYAHLQSAEGGNPTVSHVVLSAALSRPVVAFAAPYSTPYGRRVFSGAFDVNATPVANYLRNSLPQAGANAYLVDITSGVVVADQVGATPNAAPLSVQAPQLAAAVSHAPDGSFTDATGARYFVQRDVFNAPWRVVISVPDATLYAALEGPSKWAPWGMYIALVIGAILLRRLFERLQQNRRALVTANSSLELLARVDKLTGLYNRRHIEEQINVALKMVKRTHSFVCVLMIDVDHFKEINDNYGHVLGDRALHSLAEVIRFGIRPGDVCARWGGEEFVVLLPGAQTAAAVAAAERLREQAMKVVVLSEKGEALHLTISIGIAQVVDNDTVQTLMSRADTALYRAKKAGRNMVAE